MYRIEVSSTLFCSMLQTESVVIFRQEDALENDDIAVRDFVFMKAIAFGILWSRIFVCFIMNIKYMMNIRQAALTNILASTKTLIVESIRRMWSQSGKRLQPKHRLGHPEKYHFLRS